MNCYVRTLFFVASCRIILQQCLYVVLICFTVRIIFNMVEVFILAQASDLLLRATALPGGLIIVEWFVGPAIGMFVGLVFLAWYGTTGLYRTRLQVACGLLTWFCKFGHVSCTTCLMQSCNKGLQLVDMLYNLL